MVKKAAILSVLFFISLCGFGLCHYQGGAANTLALEMGLQALPSNSGIDADVSDGIGVNTGKRAYRTAIDVPTITFAPVSAPATPEAQDGAPSTLKASDDDPLGRLMADNTYYASPSMPGIIQLLLDGKQHPPPDAVVVSGPATVDERGGAQFTATAHYSDGSTKDVTARATWSEDAAAASISSDGFLTTEAVDADQPAGVTASYGGQTDTLAVTIKDVPVTLSSLVVSGPATVDESGGAQFTATAQFSDGSTADVTASAAWSEDAAAASISSDGFLTTEAVDADEPVGVTATYEGQTDTLAVTITDVPAPVDWIDDSLEFRFAVQENGGAFLYAPSFYFYQSSDTQECSYRPNQGEFDSYGCVATGNLTAFVPHPGEILLNAMAKGPENGLGPPGGLKVQGYLETLPTELTTDHALETKQKVISWVSRGFSVDQASTFTIAGSLDGVVQFDRYDNGSRDRAVYAIEGKVMLEEIIDATVFLRMPGFPLTLDDTNPSAEAQVALRTQTSDEKAVSYRLRITLKLESKIANYNQQPYTIYRALNGIYRLGTAASPFTLEATINETVAASP